MKVVATTAQPRRSRDARGCVAGTPIERQVEVVPSTAHLIKHTMGTIGGGGWHRKGHTHRTRDANDRRWPHLRHMGIRRTGLLHPHQSRDEPPAAPPPSCNALVTTTHNPCPSSSCCVDGGRLVVISSLGFALPTRGRHTQMACAIPVGADISNERGGGWLSFVTWARSR